MSTLGSLDVEIIVGGSIALFALGYAAFWAFNIRRGMTVALYRRQALGMGLVSLGFAYITSYVDGLLSYLGAYAGNVFGSLLLVLNFYALLPLFYWTDVSILVARNSDPLERDHFHWSRVRQVLWPAIIITGLVSTVVFTIPNLSLSLSLIERFALLLASVFVLLATASISLPFTARRSKDVILRTQLKWFALAAVSFLLASLTLTSIAIALFNPQSSSSLNYQVFTPIWDTLFALTGYCLFKSARSIIPVYTFSSHDSEPI